MRTNRLGHFPSILHSLAPYIPSHSFSLISIWWCWSIRCSLSLSLCFWYISTHTLVFPHYTHITEHHRGRGIITVGLRVLYAQFIDQKRESLFEYALMTKCHWYTGKNIVIAEKWHNDGSYFQCSFFSVSFPSFLPPSKFLLTHTNIFIINYK
jgi:hypothetical protein